MENLNKLNAVPPLNRLMGAKKEVELQDKSTLGSFKQRTKTVAY